MKEYFEELQFTLKLIIKYIISLIGLILGFIILVLLFPIYVIFKLIEICIYRG